jgi:hypothetical protein
MLCRDRLSIYVDYVNFCIMTTHSTVRGLDNCSATIHALRTSQISCQMQSRVRVKFHMKLDPSHNQSGFRSDATISESMTEIGGRDGVMLDGGVAGACGARQQG